MGACGWCGAPTCEESDLAWEPVGWCGDHSDAAADLADARHTTRERWFQRWQRAGYPGETDDGAAAAAVIDATGGLTGYLSGEAPDPVREFELCFWCGAPGERSGTRLPWCVKHEQDSYEFQSDLVRLFVRWTMRAPSFRAASEAA